MTRTYVTIKFEEKICFNRHNAPNFQHWTQIIKAYFISSLKRRTYFWYSQYILSILICVCKLHLILLKHGTTQFCVKMTLAKFELNFDLEKRLDLWTISGHRHMNIFNIVSKFPHFYLINTINCFFSFFFRSATLALFRNVENYIRLAYRRYGFVFYKLSTLWQAKNMVCSTTTIRTTIRKIGK